MKMPYVVGPPVRLPTDFFGREGQTRQFFETLAGTQTQCVSVLGLRRAGKTSFFQHISHPEIMASYLPDPQRYVMAYVDVSACKTPAEFYGRVYHKLMANLPRVPSGVTRSQTGNDVYDVESLLYEFGERRVIFLMDEFDQLRAADFGANFMTELRALAGIWDFELAYVTASYWDNYRLGKFVGLPPTSPFYNIFYPTPIYLSGLSPNELDDLVKAPARRVGIAADDEDVAFVRYQAGTLPFFVQAVAAIWLTYKAEGRKPDTAAASQRLVSEMWPFFEEWWSNFNDVERDVAVSVTQEKPVARLPYGEQEIDHAVQRLKNYGVLAATGDNLWVDSALFGQWIHEYTGSGKSKAAARSAITAAGTNGHAAAGTTRPGTVVHQRVLQIITDVAAQFSRLPSVYARKSDAELRDHLKLVLETGLATISGKVALSEREPADLVIIQNGENSAAISCRTWMGQAALLRNMNSLLGYLDMQRAHAIEMVFVRDQEFDLVAKAVSQAMPQHARYLGFSGQRDGRLDYRFHLNGDPHSETTVSVLLVHLPG